MDKLINSHIDSVEELERQMDVIIEQEMSQINIDEIIASPQATLSMVAEGIKQIFLDKYASETIELGFEFGRIINKKIEQDKTLKIDDTGPGNK